MENNEIIFRLLGWENSPCKEEDALHPLDRWFYKNGEYYGQRLPDVSNDYELCREYIIPEMRGRNLKYQVDSDNTFWWLYFKRNQSRYVKHSGSNIIDDNIAAALVEAAIKVLEGE